MGLGSYLLPFENPNWNYLMSKQGISQCEIRCWLRVRWGLERHRCARAALLSPRDTSRTQRDVAGLTCFKAEAWGCGSSIPIEAACCVTDSWLWESTRVGNTAPPGVTGGRERGESKPHFAAVLLWQRGAPASTSRIFLRPLRS